MEKASIQLELLTCPFCMQKIERTIKKINGVDPNSAKLLFNTSKFRSKFDATSITLEVIEKTIEDLGYPLSHSKVL